MAQCVVRVLSWRTVFHTCSMDDFGINMRPHVSSMNSPVREFSFLSGLQIDHNQRSIVAHFLQHHHMRVLHWQFKLVTSLGVHQLHRADVQEHSWCEEADRTCFVERSGVAPLAANVHTKLCEFSRRESTAIKQAQFVCNGNDLFWNKLASQLSIHVNQGVDKRYRATCLLHLRSTSFCALAHVSS